ncbi:MAG: PQQ-binding-like beta-propeller repeat protein [Isosphaeraceae bacterium]
MFRRLVPVWFILGTILAGGSARAQMPFPVDLLPTRTSLERLGLERQWYGVVPLTETERVLKISLTEGLLFAQTNNAMLLAIDSESGRLLWSTELGERTGFARGVTANSYAVFVTNANSFYCLDKRSGRLIWQTNLKTIPTSSPAADEERAMIGMTSGMIRGFSLKLKDSTGKESILTKAMPAWQWHTGGPVHTRPMSAGPLSVFGSADGRVYVIVAEERTALFRFRTGGPIGEGMGAYGTRMLLIPSGDNNLYAVDLFTSDTMWTFPSGAPIDQEPMVAEEDVFVINTAGALTVLQPVDGVPRWTTATHGGRLVSVSGTKVYLRSYDLDLFLVDRQTGRILVDPGESHLRAGLNLREYNMAVVNRYNDRMYFATPSGMVVCLRETGLREPRPVRDAKALPFGFIPPEGIKPNTPPVVPSATPEAGGEPGAEPKAEAEGDKNAEKPEPKGDVPEPKAEKKEDAPK